MGFSWITTSLSPTASRSSQSKQIQSAFKQLQIKMLPKLHNLWNLFVTNITTQLHLQQLVLKALTLFHN